MQKRYETTSLSKELEKKILSDIQYYKKAIPMVEKLLSIKPEIDKLYDKKKVLREELNLIKEDITSKETEIEGVRQEFETAKEQRADLK